MNLVVRETVIQRPLFQFTDVQGAAAIFLVIPVVVAIILVTIPVVILVPVFIPIILALRLRSVLDGYGGSQDVELSFLFFLGRLAFLGFSSPR